MKTNISKQLSLDVMFEKRQQKMRRKESKEIYKFIERSIAFIEHWKMNAPRTLTHKDTK